jgi:hypothetical protein
MSFIFISMMIKSFWKREFEAPPVSDLGERITRVAVDHAGGVIQRRHNIATELQSISALVEEMLPMAKQSYSAALRHPIWATLRSSTL